MADPIVASRLAHLYEGLPIPPKKRETFYQYWYRLLAMKDPALVTQMLERFEAPSIEAFENMFAHTKHVDGDLINLFGEIWGQQKALEIPGMETLRQPPGPKDQIWEVEMKLRAHVDACKGSAKEEEAQEEMSHFYHLLGCGCEQEYQARLNEDDEPPTDPDEEEVGSGGATPSGPPSGGNPPASGTSSTRGGSDMSENMKWGDSAQGFPGAKPNDVLGQAFLRRWGQIVRTPKEGKQAAKNRLVADLHAFQPSGAASVSVDLLAVIAGSQRQKYGGEFEQEPTVGASPTPAPSSAASPASAASSSGSSLKSLDEFYDWGKSSQRAGLPNGTADPVIIWLDQEWEDVDDDEGRQDVCAQLAKAFSEYDWTIEAVIEILKQDPEELANKRPPDKPTTSRSAQSGRRAADAGATAPKAAPAAKVGQADEGNPFAGKELVTRALGEFWATDATIMIAGAEGSMEEYLKGVFENPPEGKSSEEAIKDFYAEHHAEFPSTVSPDSIIRRVIRIGAKKSKTEGSTKASGKPASKKAAAKAGQADEGNPYAGKELFSRALGAFWSADATIMVADAEGSMEDYLKALYQNPPEGKNSEEAIKDFYAEYQAEFPSTVNSETIIGRVLRAGAGAGKKGKAAPKKTVAKKAAPKKAAGRKSAPKAAKKTAEEKAADKAKREAERKVARQARVNAALEKELLECPKLTELVHEGWPDPVDSRTVGTYLARLKGANVDPDMVYDFVAKGLELDKHLAEIAAAYTELEPIVPEPQPTTDNEPAPVTLTDEERQLWRLMCDQISGDVILAGTMRTIQRDGMADEHDQLQETVKEMAPTAADFLIDNALCVKYLRHGLGLDKLAEPVTTPADKPLLFLGPIMRAMPEDQVKQILDEIRRLDQSNR